MSYIDVIEHIELVMNKCGDNVSLITTGAQAPHGSGQMSIEIETVAILQQNECCKIPSPSPMSNFNPPDKYLVNRIRISPSLADDYSKGNPLSDDEIRNMICKKEFLFGFFEK